MLPAVFASLLLLAAAPQQAPSPALDAETMNDVRCLVATTSIVKNKDPKLAQAGMIASQYFLGRIDGRTPKLDLEDALVRAAKSISQEQMKALFQRCGTLLHDRGEAVKAIGARLEARGI